MIVILGVNGESVTVPFDISRHYNCNEVCEYDDWFNRAHCEERHLYQVPFSTGCTEAVMLEIQENYIERLTVECLTGYRKVRTLDVSRNNISIIDSGTFLGVPRLRNLLASHNHLNELPNGTFRGPEYHLERIYLSHNELRYIDEHAFKYLRHVLLLYLTYNNIETLHPRVFLGMLKLRYLHLGKNKLKFIHHGAFHRLNSLESVNLSNNKLRWIPDGLFDGLGSLREVVLSGNDIVSLPVPRGHVRYELFDVANNNLNQSGNILPYLHISDTIYIDGNPFICDCDFLLVQQWYQNKILSERQHYDIHNPIACEPSNDEDIPLSCDFTDSTSTTERNLPTAHSTLVITGHNLQSNQFIVTTEAAANVIQDKNLNTHTAKIYVFTSGEVDGKILTLSIYIATILTLFLVFWIIKTFIFWLFGYYK
ncbi:Leucine-rich repeats and immunoglobulin-like domains protein 3 [Holothuria leucospilota]|uniref:Leucine-rich repeats and immunoglobulin-like domains protein 3 n=1 Tax=Holothuria leucospilota TaxID=206669 RepID=A0A9Q1C3X3_HOLLE|nr:Leucine-rich repeats and immunoglobulin-like domains protein 3 [Holothuria leucospilota]